MRKPYYLLLIVLVLLSFTAKSKDKTMIPVESNESVVLPDRNYVTVRGVDRPQFLLVLKLTNHENKWLVDGSGVINIPENRRASK